MSSSQTLKTDTGKGSCHRFLCSVNMACCSMLPHRRKMQVPSTKLSTDILSEKFMNDLQVHHEVPGIAIISTFLYGDTEGHLPSSFITGLVVLSTTRNSSQGNWHRWYVGWAQWIEELWYRRKWPFTFLMFNPKNIFQKINQAPCLRLSGGAGFGVEIAIWIDSVATACWPRAVWSMKNTTRLVLVGWNILSQSHFSQARNWLWGGWLVNHQRLRVFFLHVVTEFSQILVAKQRKKDKKNKKACLGVSYHYHSTGIVVTHHLQAQSATCNHCLLRSGGAQTLSTVWA